MGGNPFCHNGFGVGNAAAAPLGIVGVEYLFIPRLGGHAETRLLQHHGRKVDHGNQRLSIPAGTAAYVGVFVHSEEYPQWTGAQSPYNDVLSWFVAADGQPTVSGGVLVNEEDVAWNDAVAQGWSLDGFEPVVHMGGAVYRAGAEDLEVAVDLAAANIRDGSLPSTVAVGVFPLQLVQMNMPHGAGIGGTTDDGASYRRAFIPQGGGDVRAGHRCPGEKIAVTALSAAVAALCRPGVHISGETEDRTFPWTQMLTRPSTGVRVSA